MIDRLSDCVFNLEKNELKLPCRGFFFFFPPSLVKSAVARLKKREMFCTISPQQKKIQLCPTLTEQLGSRVSKKIAEPLNTEPFDYHELCSVHGRQCCFSLAKYPLHTHAHIQRTRGGEIVSSSRKPERETGCQVT